MTKITLAKYQQMLRDVEEKHGTVLDPTLEIGQTLLLKMRICPVLL